MAKNETHPLSREYRVHGRVQGVGFRWWAHGVARELGIGGAVRNCPDGTVALRATGSSRQLAELEERLGEGPRFARVDGVDARDVPVRDEVDFGIEHEPWG